MRRGSISFHWSSDPLLSYPHALLLLFLLAVTVVLPAAAFVTGCGRLIKNTSVIYSYGKLHMGVITSPLRKAGLSTASIKEELLNLGSETDRGVSTSDSQRARIDELIASLESVNPTPDSWDNSRLSKQWDLQWTTEKEVLFLIKSGLFGLKTGLVFQKINITDRSLENTLWFGDGSCGQQQDPTDKPQGFFSVQSSIDRPADDDKAPATRVNFKFRGARIKWNGLRLPLPPIGEGWFENVYLDDDFRVSRDIRGDLQIAIRH